MFISLPKLVAPVQWMCCVFFVHSVNIPFFLYFARHSFWNKLNGSSYVFSQKQMFNFKQLGWIKRTAEVNMFSLNLKTNWKEIIIVAKMRYNCCALMLPTKILWGSSMRSKSINPSQNNTIILVLFQSKSQSQWIWGQRWGSCCC